MSNSQSKLQDFLSQLCNEQSSLMQGRASQVSVLALEELLISGANPNTKHKSGVSPAYITVQNARLDLLSLLCAHGAQIPPSERTDILVTCATQVVVGLSSLEAARRHVTHLPALPSTDNSSKPSFNAPANWHTQIIKQCLDNGARVSWGAYKPFLLVGDILKKVPLSYVEISADFWAQSFECLEVLLGRDPLANQHISHCIDTVKFRGARSKIRHHALKDWLGVQKSRVAINAALKNVAIPSIASKPRKM